MEEKTTKGVENRSEQTQALIELNKKKKKKNRL